MLRCPVHELLQSDRIGLRGLRDRRAIDSHSLAGGFSNRVTIHFLNRRTEQFFFLELCHFSFFAESQQTFDKIRLTILAQLVLIIQILPKFTSRMRVILKLLNDF